MLQGSSFNVTTNNSFTILETPPQLTALTLLCRNYDPDEKQTLRFMPSSLQSLCVRGISCSIQAPHDDTSSNASGWQIAEEHLSSDAAVSGGAASAASGTEQSSSGGSSSSSRVALLNNSAVGQALAALPLLQHAEVTVELLQDAADMLRWVGVLTMVADPVYLGCMNSGLEQCLHVGAIHPSRCLRHVIVVFKQQQHAMLMFESYAFLSIQRLWLQGQHDAA
jgi:hypothetical protein